MKSVWVLPHLRFGGAEAQTVGLVNVLRERGHDATLVTWREGDDLLPELDSPPSHIKVGGSHGSAVLGLRSAIRAIQPDVVVSRLLSGHALTRLALHGRSERARWIAFEDLDPANHFDHIAFGQPKKQIARLLYKRARAACTTSDIAVAMRSSYKIDGPIDEIAPFIRATDRLLADASSGGRLVGIGSLSKRKNWAFALDVISDTDFAPKLLLIGAGEDEVTLRNKASELGVLMDVRLLRNPVSELSPKDLLLHPSLTESFSLAIGEAISAGCRVLSRSTAGASYWQRHFPDRVRIEDSHDAWVAAINDWPLLEPLNSPDMSLWSISNTAAQWVKLMNDVAAGVAP